MSRLTRRSVIAGIGASGRWAGCVNPLENNGAAAIDARVASTVAYMHRTYPGTLDLTEKASGMLVMPLITEAGLGLGGSYGRGSLLIEDATVNYYSAASASVGIQIGAQQFAHVLFFMNSDALSRFRNSDGWAVGADVEYVVADQGGNLSVDTTNILSPVVAVIFGQAGLHVGATLEGTKYTRINPA